MRERVAVKYANYKVSVDLAKKVQDIVEAGILGYRSANEFVNDAVRRRVEELSKSAKSKG